MLLDVLELALLLLLLLLLEVCRYGAKIESFVRDQCDVAIFEVTEPAVLETILPLPLFEVLCCD